MGPFGTQELAVIFILALVLFGPRKLPEIARTVGKALSEFRRASSELKATFDREMNALEAETRQTKEIGTSHQEPYNYNYDYSSYEATYEGAYNGDEYQSGSAITASESAPQDAESKSAEPPEGVVAQGSSIGALEQRAEPSAPSEAEFEPPAYVDEEHSASESAPAAGHNT